MKRVVELLKYVLDVVEVWTPRVRKTRSDSSVSVSVGENPAVDQIPCCNGTCMKTTKTEK